MTDRLTGHSVPARLPSISVAAYGTGDIANSMTFSTVGMFLLVYYTDVAGIPAAAAGTLLLLAGLFNAGTDVFAGRIADRNNHRRLGKFRPFLLLGAVPLCLCMAMFHIHVLDRAATLTFAYVSYFAFCFAYSMVNVPYGALAGTLTRNPRDRARLASARTMGGLATTAFLGIFIAPEFENGADIQTVLTILTAAFAVVGTFLYLFTALATREQLPASAPKLTLRQAQATLTRNVPLQILCASSLFFMTANVVTNTAKLFYLRDVLGRLELFAFVAGAQVVITLVLALVAPRLVQRWGKRSIYVAGGLLGVVGSVLVFAAPAELVWLAIAGMFLSLTGAAAVSILMWALVADTVEYGEWKTGHRTDGTNYALLASTRKVGMAFGGGLAAFALAWGGYVSGATEQSATAELGIRVAAGLAQAIVLLLAVAVMKWYPLTDDAHADLVRTIQERSPDGTSVGESR
ncbi:glycoside-pentoside-hexuronide (GPH):cation symporter [uncultured Arthrobacter sp.]|uniref:glycoside-pentoside-hexuronide (GPH):cation symporter n=1 Tax=uncultured Arthrobacter sp. TaxID=114050 RepID=UPI002612EC31|nr:glycoside-pentoside-hexuronide (GPH):cation symporter [uncultured Arthrobacter sp.]